ncbi:MAG TPA: ankyrin repeat domain-containing protein [Verrucomicrobiae bacterium]|jgi:ankyrin repeat protein|nr:ankyrin repeat domain-containing protein [Verrucomicrobiae bacterium]
MLKKLMGWVRPKPTLPCLNGETPVMLTAQTGNIANTTFLIERGADVNATDLRGFTALHRAAELGHLEMAKSLLNHGARPNMMAEGSSPLSLAEMRKHSEVANLLKAKRS